MRRLFATWEVCDDCNQSCFFQLWINASSICNVEGLELGYLEAATVILSIECHVTMTSSVMILLVCVSALCSITTLFIVILWPQIPFVVKLALVSLSLWFGAATFEIPRGSRSKRAQMVRVGVWRKT